MGEYWTPVNLTRREYIDATDFGEGYQLGEWNRIGSRVMQLIVTRWPRTDTVGAISDAGRYMRRSPGGVWGFVWGFDDVPDRRVCPHFEEIEDDESDFVRVRSADQPLADVFVEGTVRAHRPNTYRPKGKVEAVRWVDTPVCRETMARWFEKHDDQFVTMGPVALVPITIGDDDHEIPVKVGEWIVRLGDAWCAMADDAFTFCYGEVP